MAYEYPVNFKDHFNDHETSDKVLVLKEKRLFPRVGNWTTCSSFSNYRRREARVRNRHDGEKVTVDLTEDLDCFDNEQASTYRRQGDSSSNREMPFKKARLSDGESACQLEEIRLIPEAESEIVDEVHVSDTRSSLGQDEKLIAEVGTDSGTIFPDECTENENDKDKNAEVPPNSHGQSDNPHSTDIAGGLKNVVVIKTEPDLEEDDGSSQKEEELVSEHQTSVFRDPIKQEEPQITAVNTNRKAIMESPGKVVNVTKLCVHSFLLCLHSKFFKSLLCSSGMKETREREVEIHLREGESKIFEKLIQAIYDPNVLLILSREDLFSMLQISDQFCCDMVTNKCVQKLNEIEVNSVEACNQVLGSLIALQRTTALLTDKLRGVPLQCREYLLETFSPLEEKLSSPYVLKQFLELKFVSFQLLMSRKNLVVPTENSILAAVILWARHNNPSISMMEGLLKIIRYEQLSSNYIHDVITPFHPSFILVPSFSQWFLKAIKYHSFSEKRKLATSQTLPARRISKTVELRRLTLEFSQETTIREGHCRVYNFKEDVIHFWNGYHCQFEFYFRDDGHVFVKLLIPNIRDSEIYFEAEVRFALYYQGSRLYSILDTAKTVCFQRRNGISSRLIDVGSLTQEVLQFGFQRNFDLEYSLHIYND